MKGLWYFAHPYTCKDEAGHYLPGAEEANFRLCNLRAARLIERGVLIYSPISHTHPIHCAHPPFVGSQAHEMWYRFDEEFIRRIPFDGIILAPGWEHSVGCRREKTLFESLGRKVKYLHEIDEIGCDDCSSH